jgi:hypothetical protein
MEAFMKHAIASVVFLFAVSTTAPVLAQGHGNGHAPKAQAQPKAAETPKAPKVMKAPKAPETAKAPKAPKAPKVHTETSTPKAHGKNAPSTTTTATTTTATTPTTVTTTTPTTQPVKNAKLEARLANLLPAGTNMTDAAKGFKNYGQFVAAVHVSNNLNIPFSTLKAKMTGTTPMSLGQAIQATRGTTTTPTTTTPPTTATTQTAVQTAERQADEDFRRARDVRR